MVLIISLLVVMMWFFIFERIWYFRFIHPAVEKETIDEWSKVSEHKSWKGHVIRSMLISKANLNNVNRHAGTVPALSPRRTYTGT